MGSTVAAQSGRGGGVGRGETRETEDLAKPEDIPIDTAEPTITLLLAAVASGPPGLVDDLGLPIPPRPCPYDASHYLPPEECALCPPPCGLNFVDVACTALALPTPAALAASASSRPKPLTFAQRALGKGLAPPDATTATTAASSNSSQEDASSSTSPATNSVGGGLTISHLATLGSSTLCSYLALSVASTRLKSALREDVYNLLTKSRVLQTWGCLPGRGSAPLALDVGDESGYSALFILASAGKLESVSLLVSAGADCCTMTKRGKTPIYGAVEKGHCEVVEWLLTRYSANQLRANTTYGTNVLHAAGKAGNSKIKDLIQVGC